MKMLSWYGTIIRTERGTGARIQAPLWPLRDMAEDLDLDLPQERIEQRRLIAGDPPIVIESAPVGRGVRLLQGEKYLSVQAGQGAVEFNWEVPRPSEIFMPFGAAEIARLRDIVSHAWRILETGQTVAAGEAWLTDGFVLQFGSHRVVLEHHMPELDVTRQMLTLETFEGKVLHARRGAEAPTRRELELTRVSPLPGAAADEAAFGHAGDAVLTLPGGTEYGFLPLTARLADQAWMYARSWRPDAPKLGPYETETRIVRQHDKFILMTPGQEGVVFDEQGVCNEAGYLFGRHVFARGALMREGNHVFLDRAVLDVAPVLTGCTVMFFNGNFSNYYHWIVDSLVPLFILRRFMPEDSRLLIPGRITSLRGQAGIVDHMAALQAWGFGDLPRAEMADPVCRAETVMWLDHVHSIRMVGDMLAAARAHVWSLSGTRAGGRRVYIQRRGSRGVMNAAELWEVLEAQGFEACEMEALSPAEQIRLFRDADYVVGTHGAALANLLYCAPGTRVLEIAPDLEYRSMFAELSDKLGLVHAILPCPADSQDFHVGMRLVVDVAAVGRLLTQLRNWH